MEIIAFTFNYFAFFLFFSFEKTLNFQIFFCRFNLSIQTCLIPLGIYNNRVRCAEAFSYKRKSMNTCAYLWIISAFSSSKIKALLQWQLTNAFSLCEHVCRCVCFCACLYVCLICGWNYPWINVKHCAGRMSRNSRILYKWKEY